VTIIYNKRTQENPRINRRTDCNSRSADLLTPRKLPSSAPPPHIMPYRSS